MKLSALWITKNEEKNIARTIQSVADVADELVVVDTGSTDDTIRIAEGLGARVVHFDWVDDFSAARNFAMRQAKGDIVIFLDADEWFDPKLKPKDRRWLEHCFTVTNAHTLGVLRRNFDEKTGLEMAVDRMPRIYRGKGAVAFSGIIHEQAHPTKGTRMAATEMPDVMIQHNGYGSEVSPQKLERNYQLLKKAVDGAPEDADRALNTFYLMRESRGLAKKNTALEAFHWLLDHPKLIPDFMSSYVINAYSLAFDGLDFAAEYRGQMSRVQLKRVLINNLKAIYPSYPGSIIIDLYYDSLFDYDEAELLAQLEPTMEKAEKLRDNRTEDMLTYLVSSSRLYTRAGVAAWRRNQRTKAFEYATEALRRTETHINLGTTSLILRCVKGLPSQDVILFLNSVMSVDKRGTLESLLAASQYEGYTDVYVYYMKKMLDAGWAKKSDFWFLMIVLDKAAEAAEAARQAQADTEEDVVQRTWFLAAVCTQSEALYREYADGMGRYTPVARAMFEGHTGEKLETEILQNNYIPVAFAAGRRVANRLMDLYADADNFKYQLMTLYYNSSGLYREFLDECDITPPENQLKDWLQLAHCNHMVGNYAKAVELLKKILPSAGLNDEWFNICAAIRDMAPPEIAAAAGELYETYRTQYEEWVDLRDAVATGLALSADTKQQRRELEKMDIGQLDELVKSLAKPPFAGQVGTIIQAADLYRKEKQYTMAVRCYCKLLSYTFEVNTQYAALAGIFEAVGNTALAAALGQRLQSPDTPPLPPS